MDKVIVYEKPTCTTCKKTIKMLNEIGIGYEKINYYLQPFTKKKLKDLLKKMEIKPSELLRRNDKAFRDLDFRNNNYSEEEILEFMIKDHNLIQRPIIEKGERAVLGRPIERIKEIF